MLVTPYYQDEYVTIYNGDCREILPQLDVKVDLVLTDPPYGIGIASNPFRQKFSKSDRDNKPVDEELLQWLLSYGDNQIIWGGNYFNLPQSKCFLYGINCNREILVLLCAKWLGLVRICQPRFIENG